MHPRQEKAAWSIRGIHSCTCIRPATHTEALSAPSSLRFLPLVLRLCVLNRRLQEQHSARILCGSAAHPAPRSSGPSASCAARDVAPRTSPASSSSSSLRVPTAVTTCPGTAQIPATPAAQPSMPQPRVTSRLAVPHSHLGMSPPSPAALRGGDTCPKVPPRQQGGYRAEGGTRAALATLSEEGMT